MLDFAYRIAYRLAYPVMRKYWQIFDPPRHGTLTAIWCRGRILIIKNSYVDFFSLPGGYVKKGEAPEDAAAREILEEVGISIEPQTLLPRPDLTSDAYWKEHNHKLSMFEVELDKEPAVTIDNREVISAQFLLPEEALRLRLYGQLRLLIESRKAKEVSK